MVGQDGKVIFLKYASFIRRVPLEHVIPADEYNNEEEETNQEDEENSRRLDDDKFDNVEIVVKKEKEIEELTKSLDDKAKIIEKSQHGCVRWALREHLTPPCCDFACGGLQDRHKIILSFT